MCQRKHNLKIINCERFRKWNFKSDSNLKIVRLNYLMLKCLSINKIVINEFHYFKIIFVKTTFVEYTEFSLRVLFLCSPDWRFETVGLILVTSSSIWIDQFLHSHKLSFNHFSWSFYVFCCMWGFFSLACDVLIFSRSLWWLVIITICHGHSYDVSMCRYSILWS